jgi:hypothetical protein
LGLWGAREPVGGVETVAPFTSPDGDVIAPTLIERDTANTVETVEA